MQTSRLESLVNQHPALGWISSVFSFIAGAFAWTIEHADDIGKVFGMIAAMFGVMAGYWTVRIQRRAFKRGQSATPFQYNEGQRRSRNSKHR